MAPHTSPSSAVETEFRSRRQIGLAVVAFLASVVVFIVGCDILQGATYADYKLENRTDSLLCYGRFPEDVAAGSCLSELDPQSEAKWTTQCNSSMRDIGLKTPITVILAVESTGEQIYKRTALCREWRDSGGLLVIEQEGNDFAVTDSLTDSIAP